MCIRDRRNPADCGDQQNANKNQEQQDSQKEILFFKNPYLFPTFLYMTESCNHCSQYGTLSEGIITGGRRGYVGEWGQGGTEAENGLFVVGRKI